MTTHIGCTTLSNKHPSEHIPKSTIANQKQQTKAQPPSQLHKRQTIANAQSYGPIQFYITKPTNASIALKDGGVSSAV